MDTHVLVTLDRSRQDSLPTLSIIVPVLEPTPDLARCLHCIAAAFDGSVMPEVLIVTTRRSVANIQSRYPWVRVIEERRRGIYAAMNDGAEFANGRYLYFLGADDIVLPSLRRAVEILAREDLFALFGDVYWGTRGRYSGRPSPARLLVRNVCHQGIIYSRAAFDRHGPYLRRMKVQADHLLNIKLLWDRVDGRRVRHLPEPLAWYSGHGFSDTHRDRLFWRLYPATLKRYVGPWASWLLIASRRLRGR